MTFSIDPKDRARIERMEQAHERSVWAQIRVLIMPLVEAWEREQGISYEIDELK